MNIKEIIKSNEVEIFTGIGIGTVITGVFVACKNTLKLKSVIEDHNKTREVIQQHKEEGYNTATETMKLYGYTAFRIIGLYAASGALITAGIGSFMHATKLKIDENIKLAEKNAALAALASGYEERFNKYRERMIKKYGENADEQLMCPEEEITEEVEETDENGRKKKVKRKRSVINPEADLNPNRFYITRSNPNWNEDDDLMQYLFRCVRDSMNDELNMRRCDGRPTWITVNDIRERLAVDPKRDLQCIGYVKDNFGPDDGTCIMIDAKKKQIPGADGMLEDVWQITCVGARDILDEMW